MSVVECGCTHSGRGSRQDWPEYCYSFWLGFLQVCDSCPWSGRITPFARPVTGFFVFTLIPPLRCPRAAAARPTVLAAIMGSGLLED